MPPCSAFDLEPLDGPEAQDFAGAAVLLSVERVEFSAAVDPESVSGEVVERRMETVDGHDAVRVETRSQGNALLPSEARSTRWFVVFGRDRTLSLVSHQTGGREEYERNSDVLDQMVARLQLPVDR